MLDSRGRAVGIVSRWYYDTATGFTDFSKATQYMKAMTNLDAIQLAKGTEPFLPL